MSIFSAKSFAVALIIKVISLKSTFPSKSIFNTAFSKSLFSDVFIDFFNDSLVVEEKTGESVRHSLAMFLRSSHAHKQPL